MKIRGFEDENFTNYKKPVMFIGSAKCDWKCCKEVGRDTSMCQNSTLAKSPVMDIENEVIYNRYIKNPLTKAIVIGGLEPMLQIDEVYSLIDYFRFRECYDPFIIYTGYYKEEILELVTRLQDFKNIIIKFGRYIPDDKERKDEVLGIALASSNQYAEIIS